MSSERLDSSEVCEKFQERAVCYVYDVTTGKRRRGQLTYGDCDAALFEIGLFVAISDPLAITSTHHQPLVVSICYPIIFVTSLLSLNHHLVPETCGCCIEAREYVCAAFSAENKFLITQGGPPDWTLILWSWDKAATSGEGQWSP